MPSAAAGRRRRSRPSPGARLASLTRLLTESRLHEERHLAFHVVDLGDEVDLGLLELPEGTHPFSELAGTTAPADWEAFGLVVHGRARHLDHPGAPFRSTFGVAVDRSGHEASVGLVGDDLVDLPGRPVGTIPDLCRRVLDRPTAPAPPTTAGWWAGRWLSDLLEAWQDPARRRALSSGWPAVAALHPSITDQSALEPAALVRHAAEWTAAHPWAALRLGPPLQLPDGPLPPAVAAWMDDGFFARWVCGAYPSVPSLAAEVLPLLDRPLRDTLTDVLVALLGDPSGARSGVDG